MATQDWNSPITRMATSILMLTGVRTIELQATEWAEFNFENARWTVPERWIYSSGCPFETGSQCHCLAGLVIRLGLRLHRKCETLCKQWQYIRISRYALPVENLSRVDCHKSP